MEVPDLMAEQVTGDRVVGVGWRIKGRSSPGAGCGETVPVCCERESDDGKFGK